MKRVLAMLLAGAFCVLVACGNSPVEPESYRYLGTQSYDYVMNTPSYAENFVNRNITPLLKADDWTKAVQIMSIVCKQMTYDYEALEGVRADKVRANNLDNFFLKGRGICWCYSRAYVYLCREAGLRAYEIVGYADGNCHAWCAVWVNGVRYYVDPCYYDTGASFEACFSNHPLPNHTFSYF